jgi:hypothetical protein
MNIQWIYSEYTVNRWWICSEPVNVQSECSEWMFRSEFTVDSQWIHSEVTVNTERIHSEFPVNSQWIHKEYSQIFSFSKAENSKFNIRCPKFSQDTHPHTTHTHTHTHPPHPPHPHTHTHSVVPRPSVQVSLSISQMSTVTSCRCVLVLCAYVSESEHRSLPPKTTLRCVPNHPHKRFGPYHAPRNTTQHTTAHFPSALSLCLCLCPSGSCPSRNMEMTLSTFQQPHSTTLTIINYHQLSSTHLQGQIKHSPDSHSPIVQPLGLHIPSIHR